MKSSRGKSIPNFKFHIQLQTRTLLVLQYTNFNILYYTVLDYYYTILKLYSGILSLGARCLGVSWTDGWATEVSIFRTGNQVRIIGA